MPPRRHLNRKEVREPVNDWNELRQTLLAIQENIQATIHESIHEVVELFQLRDQCRRRSRRGSDVESEDDVNPFAGYRSRRGDNESDMYKERNDRHWESGFKVEIPEFHGSVRGEELLDWLVAVEEAMEFKQVPGYRKVALVATKFRGKAASWWLLVKATRSRAGKEKIRSWEKLQRLLKETFLPYNFDRTMFTRFQNLRQGSHSVNDYVEEFSLLFTRNEIFDSEMQLVSRFIGGRRPQVQNAMSQFDPVTVAEAHRRDVAFEQQFQYASESWNSGGVQNGNQSGSWTEPATIKAGGKEIAENNANTKLQSGLGGDDQALRRSTRPNVLCCYSCGEVGHRQTACPNQTRRGLLTDDVRWDTNELFEPDGDDEVVNNMLEDHNHGDQGNMLMLRHVCLSPITIEEPWLQTHIFQSTCTVQGKVCRFVIDSGSSSNVISEEAVNKLGLVREAHPSPYKLTWLKTGTEIRVTHRCLVSLSIGPFYKDKIYCDIAPMDVSHILLGRPWQYDRSVLHDGRRNTHAFVFENRRIILFQHYHVLRHSLKHVLKQEKLQQF
ncbi:hypothetical protein AALP_AA2G183700 [Arabis alpina]|uniref:CCHC-type domain-containing protein n=1 Tax=Arabis alpina TaxID=50452 RepID=A0A087HIC8_ARAAL|nr:hypothetical protein AALP_AA2G183700 [Arabis alpina]